MLKTKEMKGEVLLFLLLKNINNNKQQQRQILFKFKLMSKDKESICVTVRVRPLSHKQLEQDSRTCLRVDESVNMISMTGLNSEKQAKDFYFDSVCDTISQNQMFVRVGKRSTVYCMEGYNCTIFAYGQTGAGKTFTMMGLNPESPNYFEQRGLVPRTLQHLFQCIQKQISDAGVDYIIKCSFVEIYNQQIIDLLGNNQNSALNIRQDLKKGVYIEGVTQQLISHSEEAMDILRKGTKGRHVGSTCYNQTSSRSHSVFTMQIQSQQLCNGIKSTKSRHFHFIDLAGSQRTKKSMGDRLKQGCSINKSLHVLSMVISSLAEVSEGKARHVNYRDSKLTFLLKDSLGGNSKTHLIANISPSLISSLQTKSTLMFARKVKLIKVNKVSINEDASGNLESLKAEIRRLRSQNLLLRNGNMQIPATISESNESQPSLQGNLNNTKMVNVLQQYVDQELEKQTHLELEITKLQNKNTHLQRGIKHFSDNEKQLRMIIAIYEDKIKKLKKAESLLLAKIQDEDGDQAQQTKRYFTEQRQMLLDEIEKFKQISTSTVLVKNLLRELKVLKENPESSKEEQSLIAILAKNNEFLQQIKKSISELEPQMQEGKASKAVVKENNDLKSINQQLSEKAEKYVLELSEAKDKIEETQNLLNEAISNQISLEKKLQVQNATHQKEITSLNEHNSQLLKLVQKSEQKIKWHISKGNELEMVISQSQLQVSQLKSELARLKERKEFEELNFQERLETLAGENMKLDEVIRKKNQEIQKLKVQTLNIKAESERMNKEAEQVLAEASLKIQQLQDLATRLEAEKAEARNKFENQKNLLIGEISEATKNADTFVCKNKELSQQIKGLQQQLMKQQQEFSHLKQSGEQSQRSYEQQKIKWEENHNELIRMINQKKACDSETQAKLTQSQLQIINLNEKLSEMGIQQKKMIDTNRSALTSLEEKISDLQEQLGQKCHILEQQEWQNNELKRKNQILSETEQSLKRQGKVLEEQILFKEEQQSKLNEQLQKYKKKEKDSRSSISELKNQILSNKKAYQLELNNFRDQIRGYEDKISKLEVEKTGMKELHDKAIQQVHRKLDSELERYKQNEGSIRKAMETHLNNKQKRINELKSINQNLELQINAKGQKIGQLEEENTRISNQLAVKSAQLAQSQKMNQETEKELEKYREQIEQLEINHIRAVEEMENNFNQQSDSKNAEIAKLRKINQQNEQKLLIMTQVQEQNNKLKSDLINKQSSVQELEQVRAVLLRDLQSIRNNGEQANNYVIQLEGQLKERQIYINQVNQSIKIIQKTMTEQMSEKEQKIRLLESMVQNNGLQLENLKKLNSKIMKQKQENLAEFEDKNQQLTAKVINLVEQNNILKKQCQQLSNSFNSAQQENQKLLKQSTLLEQKLGDCQLLMQSSTNILLNYFTLQKSQRSSLESIAQRIVKQVQAQKMESKNVRRQFENMNRSLHEEKESLVQAIKDLQGQMVEKSQSFSKAIQKLKLDIQKEMQRNSSLNQQMKQISESNLIKQRTINQMNVIKERNIKEIEILQLHLSSTQKKALDEEAILNQRLSKVIQESSSQIRRLNQLFENSKMKNENLKNQHARLIENEALSKKTFEIKIQQLENQIKNKQQVINRVQVDLNTQKERSQELKKYIEEQSNKISQLQNQKQRLAQQTIEIKSITERKLKESEKRCQQGAIQMNGLKEEITKIQEEASIWKQRMENLQNQIRLSNERAQKFKSQYIKEKQMNKQFKLLLDNAHSQIQTFKSEVGQKDKLYHQLLEKVSKNDIERKGLLNNDKKFSELLEKSRTELSEMRKKYDDQLKINNLLKQQLEKKDVDVSVVRERSEQYCRKNMQLLQSIRSDYTKIENELKVSQNSLAESKKSMKKITLKNQQLETQIQSLNKEMSELQSKNAQLKKQTLKNGMDQKHMTYMNKLKQQNTQLRRQLEKVNEQLITASQEKIRMKAEFRQGKQPEMSNLELNKKISEVKYLQKIIDDSVNVLGIRDYKKSIGDSLKFGILELQRELARYKSQAAQLNDQMVLKNQKLQILENQKFKTGNLKEDEDQFSKMRNKISRVSSTFESIRQSKEDDKHILHMKDQNKWGINRP